MGSDISVDSSISHEINSDSPSPENFEPHTFDINVHAYHGDNYDRNASGAYNVGYEQGYEDSVNGCSSDNPADYVVPACTADGNQGYVDGVADGGNFGNDK
jgi:hypothetical protein